MTTVGDEQRKILGLMAITGTFAVAGGYVKSKGYDPFKTILGVGIASGLLVGMSEFGEDPATFAQGLAIVAALTSALVYGGPVWTTLSKYFGAKPTTPFAGPNTVGPTLGGPTGTTTPAGQT